MTDSTSTPIHTGEEIYLRENFKDLIETQAVDVLGPDPEDVGGIAELKWIAEYANLHGILVAPHGIFDGLFGVAAQVHMGAALPQNYIAFEYAKGQPEWWYDIVDGLPDPIVKNGFIDVWDKPGLGLTFRVQQPKRTSRKRIATSSTKPRPREFRQPAVFLEALEFRGLRMRKRPVVRNENARLLLVGCAADGGHVQTRPAARGINRPGGV